MKAIAIYSGKGGAGKSTVAALLALSLSKTRKVALLDADIATPSTPVLFHESKEIKNLRIFSTGYASKKTLVFTGGVLRNALKELAKEVVKWSPDICIIDLPPGTGDIQLEVCNRLKPSSFILVVQPNKLCVEDAIRATLLFQSFSIPIAGTINNMVGDVFGTEEKVLGLPVLASIPLREDMAKAGSAGTLADIDNPLDAVAEKITKKATDILWDEVFAEKVIEEAAKIDIFDPKFIRERKFISVDSWDGLRHNLDEMFPDNFLLMEDAKSLREMLEHLGQNENAMFMVCRSPNTSIPLIPGEIGIASLDTEKRDSYYGVPRLLYHTDTGNVTLFSHEVKPMTSKAVIELADAGDIVVAPSSNTPRYLPTPKMLGEIYEMFGNMVHIPQEWEKIYKKLGIKTRGIKIEPVETKRDKLRGELYFNGVKIKRGLRDTALFDFK